ncbi:mRNA interferase RelE/StbE [Fodinibius roseus]|uniref:mRNA interferase RelE/StbE n=1 Tax=Fodinibius roseus TaxID=1194090 RepID=A0A1M5LUQ6_9BACT|nr:type II toxin-antitoxin system RelE/ParE family toxin [Fodinibius roseus]SHG68123.1 mRNA interferase RelE/StbE [Fodinibius roseus]
MPRSYNVVFSKRARRDIKKMDPDAQAQIIEAAEALAENPRPQSSKPMRGEYKGFWRERTGNYRIIYEIQDQKLVVFVIRAGHRKDIYT